MHAICNTKIFYTTGLNQLGLFYEMFYLSKYYHGVVS
jgi:hypothetical protein